MRRRVHINRRPPNRRIPQETMGRPLVSRSASQAKSATRYPVPPSNHECRDIRPSACVCPPTATRRRRVVPVPGKCNSCLGCTKNERQDDSPQPLACVPCASALCAHGRSFQGQRAGSAALFCTAYRPATSKITYFRSGSTHFHRARHACPQGIPCQPREKISPLGRNKKRCGRRSPVRHTAGLSCRLYRRQSKGCSAIALSRCHLLSTSAWMSSASHLYSGLVR